MLVFGLLGLVIRLGMMTASLARYITMQGDSSECIYDA